jgi:hypothetical protein
MRWAALVLLAVVLTGCGSTKAEPKASPQQGDASKLVVQPAGRLGAWQKLLLSPDTRTYLGQWSGECETQTAYFVPARGGKPRPVTGHASDESIALGWVGRRARILVPRAACGSQFGKPGIYLVDRAGHATLVKRLKGQLGGP